MNQSKENDSNAEGEEDNSQESSTEKKPPRISKPKLPDADVRLEFLSPGFGGQDSAAKKLSEILKNNIGKNKK
jgi:hypothetical protein